MLQHKCHLMNKRRYYHRFVKGYFNVKPNRISKLKRRFLYVEFYVDRKIELRLKLCLDHELSFCKTENVNIIND